MIFDKNNWWYWLYNTNKYTSNCKYFLEKTNYSYGKIFASTPKIKVIGSFKTLTIKFFDAVMKELTNNYFYVLFT